MKKVLLNLSETDIEQLKSIATKENKSKSDIVRSALRNFFIGKKKEEIQKNQINKKFESLNKE